jgi:serine/threonine-protein kinase
MLEDILLNDRYLIQGHLGKGGMAVVYDARDLMLERTVAIKILRESFSQDPQFRERFRQEAKAAANLSHPNIVTVHDFGFDSGRLFIVMEYVPGINLKTMQEQRGHFSVDEAVPLIVQSCAGVGYAHRAGLVHCDIKPHNILVTPDKRIKVTDFGIARALTSIHPEERTEVVWGSPQYFSPEQAFGAAPSPASDVYGIGVIYYEMLTGRLPFMGSSNEELARMHLEENPIPPSMLNQHIPPVLEQIMLKILAKEPSARYRTADQLGRVLITFAPQQDSPITSVNSSRDLDLQAVPVKAKREASRIGKNLLSIDKRDPGFMNLDWITLGLGILALITVGGLIPFWVWVYFVYNPPLP